MTVPVRCAPLACVLTPTACARRWQLAQDRRHRYHAQPCRTCKDGEERADGEVPRVELYTVVARRGGLVIVQCVCGIQRRYPASTWALEASRPQGCPKCIAARRQMMKGNWVYRPVVKRRGAPEYLTRVPRRAE